jgi:UDP-N-acetylglucosamine 4,6-dehydratase/5-epimerase
MLSLKNIDIVAGKNVLITGGTGSLGKTITRILLEKSKVKKIIIFSRDELKQFEMQRQFAAIDKDTRLRYFIGDIRDKDRCFMAFRDVNIIFHTAALKQVPAAEYNPFEFVKTNILGSQNVIEVSIERGVERVIALSTDKAANPINLYGSTKFCADKLFVAGNHYSGDVGTIFSVVRYGNVIGSRGSVIPFFLEKRKEGFLPITHLDMTRFWITLPEAANFVINCLHTMVGGEIFIPKIPSMKISELAKTLAPECELRDIGIRPGEKLHEVMLPEEVGRDSLEFPGYYIIKPSVPKETHIPAWESGKSCPDGFAYTSDNNNLWVSQEQFKQNTLDLNLPETEQLRKEWGL